MSGTTLCIIDMQSNFEASLNKNVLAGVLHEIQLAKRRHDPIIVVEYDRAGCVETQQCVLDAVLKSGCEFDICFKYDDDGSHQVKAACRKNRFSQKKFRVCGVNRSFCVFDTACGLVNNSRKHSIVEVAWNATGDRWWSESAKKIYERAIEHSDNKLRIRK